MQPGDAPALAALNLKPLLLNPTLLPLLTPCSRSRVVTAKCWSKLPNCLSLNPAGEERLLPLPLQPDGAVGWACTGDLH
jgi:hypothetical protein